MITPHNFEADINNFDALGLMIRLKPTDEFEGGTALLAPHTFGPPIHFHPQQAELFKVIQGELEVFKCNKWITLHAGDKLLIPKRTPHTYRNISNEAVVFDFAVTPKIGLTYLLLTIDELVKSGKIKGQKDLRSLLYLCKTLGAFPEITQNVKPAQWVVRMLTGLATMLGFTIEREKFKAEFFRPVKLWKGRSRQPVDVSGYPVEEALF